MSYQKNSDAVQMLKKYWALKTLNPVVALRIAARLPESLNAPIEALTLISSLNLLHSAKLQIAFARPGASRDN